MPDPWPDWAVVKDDPGKNSRTLARYVDRDRAKQFGLVPADCFSPWEGIEAGEARARQLYRELRDRRIPYAHDPWNPARFDREGQVFFQRVRTPYETIQGPATCLDLTLLFAGAALDADMRPLIALRTDPPAALHALVVLDVTVALSGQGREGFDRVPHGFSLRAGESEVWDLTGTLGVDDQWLIIDVAQAAREPRALAASQKFPREGAPFDEATSQGNAWQFRDAANAGQKWTLIDVDRARLDLDAYALPAGRAVSAIHGYLPALPSFTDYGTRQELLRKLHDRVGQSSRRPSSCCTAPRDAGRACSRAGSRRLRTTTAAGSSMPPTTWRSPGHWLRPSDGKKARRKGAPTPSRIARRLPAPSAGFAAQSARGS